MRREQRQDEGRDSPFVGCPPPIRRRPRGRRRWPHPRVRRSFAPAASGGDALNADWPHVKCVLHVIHVSTARNITLTLDEETLRGARVLAASRGVSVSALLRTELARLVGRQQGYEKARASAKRRLERGQAMGGGRLVSREDLHDRAKLR
jgi:hypothetical protein